MVNLLRRLFVRQQPTPSRGQGRGDSASYVRVAYREFHQEAPTESEGGYLYRWALPQPPFTGARIIVPAAGEMKQAVVVGPGRRSDYSGPLEDVSRLATAKELAAAEADRARAEREYNTWLDMMRAAAGLSVSGPLPTQVPHGFPEIPPVDQAPRGSDHVQIARAWWRAYKSARDPLEEQAFHLIGTYWFEHSRGEGEPAEHLRRDLRAVGRDQVRGRRYTDWVEPVKQMRRDGDELSALELLAECQAATLTVHWRKPAPWYFEQAAIIHRKARNYQAEIEVLERYLSACDSPSQRLVERYSRVRELADVHADGDHNPTPEGEGPA